MEVFYPGLEIFRKGYGHMVVCPVVDGETAQEQSVFPAVGVVEVASAQEQLVAASGHRQLVLVSVGVFKLRLPVGRQHRLCFVAGELEGRVSFKFGPEHGFLCRCRHGFRCRAQACRHAHGGYD